MSCSNIGQLPGSFTRIERNKRPPFRASQNHAARNHS